MSYYVLYIDGATTEHRIKGTSPAKALRELTEMAGLTLTSQNGRYGRDGDSRTVVALTQKWGRVDSRRTHA
jgi:hypothetical protein